MRAVAACLAAALIANSAGCGGSRPRAVPVISDVSPHYLIAGTGGFNLLVDVANVKPNDVLLWNGTQLSTEADTNGTPGDYVGLSAPVPASYIAQAGAVQIAVLDPDTGVKSAPVSLGVDPPQQAGAGVVALISAAPDGSPADGDIRGSPLAISADGRYVAFQDTAGNLLPGSQLGHPDIYLRDTCTGAAQPCTPSTIRISIAADGGLANAASQLPAISGDGRYVAFNSGATNIVLGSAGFDVFVRDTCNGAPSGCTPQTTLQSPADGDDPMEGGGDASLDATGRFLAYGGYGVNGEGQVYWRDTCAGRASGCTPTTILASPAASGGPGNSVSSPQVLGATGRFIAFESGATDLVPGGSQSMLNIFLRDTCQHAPVGCAPSTLQVDVSSSGAPANRGANPGVGGLALSADGRYVAFQMQSNETAIAPNPGKIGMVYVRDTCTGATAGCQPQTVPIPVGVDGSPPNAGSDDLSMTPDGRFVAYASLATNLVYGQIGPAGNQKDIFVRDTCAGAAPPCTPATVWVSVGPHQMPSLGDCDDPAISADGHYVAFLCVSDNLLPGSYNGHAQVYLAKTGF